MPRTPPGRTRDLVFRFVEKRLRQGDSPSLREIRDHFGFRAVETVRAHLAVLVTEGRLLKTPGRARGYRLPPLPFPESASRAPFVSLRSGSGRDFSDRFAFGQVPLLGEVAAGGFEEAVENPEGSIRLELPAHRESSDYFALRVRGESMTGAGILPGDTVIVDRGTEPRSGQIVVALLDDEATVKRLHLGPDGPELRPENPAFEVLHPPGDACRILGRVVEVRRRLA